MLDVRPAATDNVFKDALISLDVTNCWHVVARRAGDRCATSRYSVVACVRVGWTHVLSGTPPDDVTSSLCYYNGQLFLYSNLCLCVDINTLPWVGLDGA